MLAIISQHFSKNVLDKLLFNTTTLVFTLKLLSFYEFKKCAYVYGFEKATDAKL